MTYYSNDTIFILKNVFNLDYDTFMVYPAYLWQWYEKHLLFQGGLESSSSGASAPETGQ